MAEKDFTDEMDDWETLVENGELEKQINALKIKKNEVSNEKCQPPQTNDPSYNLEFGRVKILQNNEQRTQYKPTIKLLKREPTDDTKSNSNMGERKPSYKTLQQREQEYAEARKRILGSAGEENGSSEAASPSSGENSPRISQRNPVISNEKAVIRTPNGPDTSKGFKSRKPEAKS